MRVQGEQPPQVAHLSLPKCRRARLCHFFNHETAVKTLRLYSKTPRAFNALKAHLL